MQRDARHSLAQDREPVDGLLAAGAEVQSRKGAQRVISSNSLPAVQEWSGMMGGQQHLGKPEISSSRNSVTDLKSVEGFPERVKLPTCEVLNRCHWEHFGNSGRRCRFTPGNSNHELCCCVGLERESHSTFGQEDSWTANCNPLHPPKNQDAIQHRPENLERTSKNNGDVASTACFY